MGGLISLAKSNEANQNQIAPIQSIPKTETKKENKPGKMP
jgi:hypothetical protein